MSKYFKFAVDAVDSVCPKVFSINLGMSINLHTSFRSKHILKNSFKILSSFKTQCFLGVSMYGTVVFNEPVDLLLLTHVTDGRVDRLLLFIMSSFA